MEKERNSWTSSTDNPWKQSSTSQVPLSPTTTISMGGEKKDQPFFGGGGMDEDRRLHVLSQLPTFSDFFQPSVFELPSPTRFPWGEEEKFSSSSNFEDPHFSEGFGSHRPSSSSSRSSLASSPPSSSLSIPFFSTSSQSLPPSDFPTLEEPTSSSPPPLPPKDEDEREPLPPKDEDEREGKKKGKLLLPELTKWGREFRDTFESLVVVEWPLFGPIFPRKKEIGENFVKLVAPLLGSSLKETRVYTNLTLYFMNNSYLCSTLYVDFFQKIQTDNPKVLHEYVSKNSYVIAALKDTKKSTIPFLMNSLGQYLKRTLSSLENEKFSSAIVTYINYMKKNPEEWHPHFEEIACNYLEFLETHSIDPCNFFLGALPSPFFSEKHIQEPLGQSAAAGPNLFDLDYHMLLRWRSLRHAPEKVAQEIQERYEEKKKSYGLVEGEIVVVPIQSVPRKEWFWNKEWNEHYWEFVFCRISRVSQNFVEIFLDPFETMTVTVERNVIRKLKGSLNPIYGEKNTSNVMMFSNPLFPWEKEAQKVIADTISTILIENGIDVDRDDKSSTMVDLVSLIEERESLKDLWGPGFGELHVKVYKKVHEVSVKKLENHLPIGLFAPPRLPTIMHEIEAFFKKLPFSIKRELRLHLFTRTQKIEEYGMILTTLLNGSRKMEVCNSWLEIIEKGVDKFLENKGYNHNVIPYQYLNCSLTPKEKETVRQNHKLLQGILNENPGGELDKTIHGVKERVYEVIDPFVKEIEQALELGDSWADLGEGIEFQDKFRSMIEDLNYLKEMKRMDEEIASGEAQERKKFEMTKAVPVAGIFMARIHIYESECLSVLEVNKKVEKKQETEEEMDGEETEEEKEEKDEFDSEQSESETEGNEGAGLGGGWEL